jgi:hypothetical protein
MTRQQTVAMVGAVAALVVVGVLAGGVGASPSAASASPHGAENGNYTVDLPFATDHYPRDENPGGPANASINHFAGFTKEQFDKRGAPRGVEELDYIIISNQDIDFSGCATENTAAFGIDRDSTNPGTKTDIDLLQYRENSLFKKHSIVIEFYDDEDLAAPSPEDKGGPGEEPWKEGQGREDGDGDPEVYPDDQIVAHQGYRAGGGPCYRMPEEPGWYQINAFGNGTSFSGNPVKVDTKSHYFYICECDSEQEAVEQLGKRPSQRDDGGSNDDSSTVTATPTPESSGGSDGGDSSAGAATPTATPTPTDSPTATPTDSPTPTPTDSPTPTPTDSPTPASDGDAEASGGGSDGGGAGGAAATASATAGGNAEADSGGSGQQNNQQQVQQNQPGSGPTTPTVGTGPGFGLVAALGGLAAAALLAVRRH